MSLPAIIFLGIVMNSSFAYSQFLLVSGMLGERIRLRPFLINLVVHNSIVLLLDIGPIYTFEFNLSNYPVLYNVLANIVLHSIRAAILIAVFHIFYRTAIPKAITAAALSHFITYTLGTTGLEAFILSHDFVMDDTNTYVLLGIVVPTVGVVPIALLAAYLLKKINFIQYFSSLFSSRIKSVIIVVISVCLMHSLAIYVTLYPDMQFSLPFGLFCLFIVMAAMLGIQFWATYMAGQDKIRAQEETIAEQQAHLTMLEDLQREYRMFRHDLTNLLSGAALHAKEGNLAAVRDFMKNTGSYFDDKLGKQIEQLEGLSRVDIFPLRSLLTAKLTAMRQKNIAVKLEILEAVKSCVMRPEDLIRCMGILLDNAREGTPESGGIVHIILLQQPSELSVVIANTYQEKPDLSQIGQDGFSTKGKGRGTGLASYYGVLSHYPGCVTRAYLKDGFFAQELRIPRDGKEVA